MRLRGPKNGRPTKCVVPLDRAFGPFPANGPRRSKWVAPLEVTLRSPGGAPYLSPTPLHLCREKIHKKLHAGFSYYRIKKSLKSIWIGWYWILEAAQLFFDARPTESPELHSGAGTKSTLPCSHITAHSPSLYHLSTCPGLSPPLVLKSTEETRVQFFLKPMPKSIVVSLLARCVRWPSTSKLIPTVGSYTQTMLLAGICRPEASVNRESVIHE